MKIKHEVLEYPVQEAYPAIYRDDRGEEATTIHNDGKTLRMTVRGVAFVGSSPDALTPVADTDSSALASFTFNPNLLCNCEIAYEMQIAMQQADIFTGKVSLDSNASLKVQVILGTVNEQGVLKHIELLLQLSFRKKIYTHRSVPGDFANSFHRIQTQLPEGTRPCICTQCINALYNPYGHFFFGDLYCCRDNQTAIVNRGYHYLLLPLLRTEGITEVVQETYRCPHFGRMYATYPKR